MFVAHFVNTISQTIVAFKEPWVFHPWVYVLNVFLLQCNHAIKSLSGCHVLVVLKVDKDLITRHMLKVHVVDLTRLNNVNIQEQTKM